MGLIVSLHGVIRLCIFVSDGGPRCIRVSKGTLRLVEASSSEGLLLAPLHLYLVFDFPMLSNPGYPTVIIVVAGVLMLDPPCNPLEVCIGVRTCPN